MPLNTIIKLSANVVVASTNNMVTLVAEAVADSADREASTTVGGTDAGMGVVVEGGRGEDGGDEEGGGM